MSAPPTFSIRDFLYAQEALLVHFNTPMSQHPTGFPQDLRDAQRLTGHSLSFSTIQIGDLGPTQIAPAAANAGGSVGMIVDINDVGCVETVDHTDSGSIGGVGSAGLPPDAATCPASITRRTTANEWWVKDYTPLGIFLFAPTMVFVRRSTFHGEVPVELPEIIRAFPNDRIFSVYDGSFVEYASGRWSPATYADIVP